jgi:hypothetical protein
MASAIRIRCRMPPSTGAGSPHPPARVRDTDRGQQLLRLSAGLTAAHAPVDPEQLTELAAHRQHGVQGGQRILKHHGRFLAAQPVQQEARLELLTTPGLEQTVRARYEAGQSQRAIARELDIDRRKVKRILDPAA